MTSLRAVLSDRRRSQRGSVLSGVLIIMAFLAIIAGALMTELSTNFLLSVRLVNRVAVQATVNSATEVAIGQLQDTVTTPLYDGCPLLSSTTLNGMTAVPAYSGCALVIDSHSAQSFTRFISSSAFNVDGTHAVLPTRGIDQYLAADSGGNVFATQTGQSSPNWSVPLGGSATGPPVAIPDPSGSQDVSYLVPVSKPSLGATPGCEPPNDCVANLTVDGAGPPTLICYLQANGPVTSAAAVGANVPDEAYFGDNAGFVYAYDPTEGGRCEQDGQQATISNDPVVAGPYVFKGPSGVDEIYVLTASGILERFTFSRSLGLQQTGSSILLSGVPAGAALASSTLPTRLAIAFGSGKVALVQISSAFGMSLLATSVLPSGIDDAPFWCHCPGGSDLIGAGGTNGALYVLDTALTVHASFQGSASITTTPGADAGGDWFIPASDGTITEVQGSGAMAQVAKYGSSGSISSSPQTTQCPEGVCIYFGSSDSSLYLLPLDARRVVLNSCVSSAPPACDQGINPRLWTSMEVGVNGSPQTVHVKGWSYYSP